MRAALLLFGRPALFAAGLAAAGLVLRDSGLTPDMEAVGANGPWAFVTVAALLCAVGVPRQAVAYAAGLVWGFWAGTALALAAELLGAAASFAWARGVARDWATRRMQRAWGGRVARLHARLAARPFTTTLVLRLLPVGNNLLLTLFAAVTGLRAAPFLAASAIGYVPQTVVFAMLGHGVRVDRGAQVALAAALFAASALLGVLLMRGNSVDSDPGPA